MQLSFLALAIHAMLPNRLNDQHEDDQDYDSIGLAKAEDGWDQSQFPSTPSQAPYTPRTLAFRTLDRKPTYG